MRSFDDFTHCFWFLASMPVVLEEKLAGRSIPITWVYKGRIALPLKSRQNRLSRGSRQESGILVHEIGKQAGIVAIVSASVVLHDPFCEGIDPTK